MADKTFWEEYEELLDKFPHGNEVVEFSKKWHDHMSPNGTVHLLLIAFMSEMLDRLPPKK